MGRRRSHLFWFTGHQFLKDIFKKRFQDRTVKVWRAEDGVVCRTLTGHAHWINTLALSVDYVLRIGFFTPESKEALEKEEVNLLNWS
jgi:ribosome assembly protein 4